MNKFRIKYSVADGYVGKDRPHYCNAEPYLIEDDMTDVDLANLYSSIIQEDFEQNIFPEGDNEEAFIEWAKQVIASRDK